MLYYRQRILFSKKVTPQTRARTEFVATKKDDLPVVRRPLVIDDVGAASAHPPAPGKRVSVLSFIMRYAVCFSSIYVWCSWRKKCSASSSVCVMWSAVLRCGILVSISLPGVLTSVGNHAVASGLPGLRD